MSVGNVPPLGTPPSNGDEHALVISRASQMHSDKVSKSQRTSKEDQERDDSLLREYEDDEQTIFDRIKKFYPDDQDKKSTGFVLRKCASVIAMDSRPFEHWLNHFLFVPLILLPLMILAYVFYLGSIRSITGPAFFLALVCLIIFTLVAGVLMGFWYSFWKLGLLCVCSWWADTKGPDVGR